MTDLTTLLSFFLKDLYAGTLGTTAPVTGILTTAAGTYGWTGRSILTSPADGVVEATNNAGTGFTRLILGTNDGTANGVALNLNSGVLEAKTGDGTTAFASVKALSLATNGATAGASGTLALGSKASVYNGIATAGYGVDTVYAHAVTTSQVNTGNTSIATYANPAAAGVFRVSADVSITSGTNFSFSIDVTYTDDAANARTLVLPMYATTGAQLTSNLMTNTVGTGAFVSATMEIRADPSTTITVRTSAGGTFTTVTYTAAATITQVG